MWPTVALMLTAEIAVRSFLVWSLWLHPERDLALRLRCHCLRTFVLVNIVVSCAAGLSLRVQWSKVDLDSSFQSLVRLETRVR
jgi:hypothetical protein